MYEPQQIRSLLEEIKSFYAQHSPVDLTRKIEPPAESEIAAFEGEFGERFPNDYRSFLLLNDVRYQFVFNFECLSFNLAIKSWRSMCRLLGEGVFADGRIERHIREEFGNWNGDFLKVRWWNKKWFPFAEDSCGNMYCIDFDPGENGRKHQILNMEVQDGQGPFLYSREGFGEFLKKHLSYLRNGQYEIYEHGIEVDSYTKPKQPESLSRG